MPSTQNRASTFPSSNLPGLPVPRTVKPKRSVTPYADPSKQRPSSSFSPPPPLNFPGETHKSSVDRSVSPSKQRSSLSLHGSSDPQIATQTHAVNPYDHASRLRPSSSLPAPPIPHEDPFVHYARPTGQDPPFDLPAPPILRTRPETHDSNPLQDSPRQRPVYHIWFCCRCGKAGYLSIGSCMLMYSGCGHKRCGCCKQGECNKEEPGSKRKIATPKRKESSAKT